MNKTNKNNQGKKAKTRNKLQIPQIMLITVIIQLRLIPIKLLNKQTVPIIVQTRLYKILVTVLDKKIVVKTVLNKQIVIVIAQLLQIIKQILMVTLNFYK